MAKDKEIGLEALIEKVKDINAVPGDWSGKTFYQFQEVYKTLIGLTKYKIKRRETYPDEETISLKDSFQPYFYKKYGSENTSEKKLKEFLITLFKFQSYPKVNIFMRFFGLLEGSEYSLSEQKLYLKCFESINTKGKGFEPTTDYKKGTTYVSYKEIRSFIKNVISYKLDSSSTNLLAEEAKKLKRASGVIEFDRMMLKVFACLKLSLDKKIFYYGGLFKALDFKGKGNIEFSKIENLYQIVEKNGEFMHEKEKRNIVVRYCLYTGQTFTKNDMKKIENSMDLNSFTMMCNDL